MWGGLLWLRGGQPPGETELDSLGPTGAKEKSAWSLGDRGMGQRRDSFHGGEGESALGTSSLETRP